MKKPINADDLVQEYLTGKSARQISKERGLDPHTVGDVLRKNNVKLRTRAEYTKLGKDRVFAERFPPELVESVVAAYVAGEGARDVAKRFGIDFGVVYKWLGERGVTRSGSEASVLRYSRTTVEYRNAITAAAHKANVGRVHLPGELERMAVTRQRELTVAAGIETPLKDALIAARLSVVPQRALGTYNLDIALEKLRVAVEIQCGCSYSFLYTEETRKRLEYVFGQGWSVLYVVTRGRGFVFPDVTKKVLAFCQIAGRGKPFARQYGVVRSDAKNLTRRGPNPNGFPRVPGF